MRQTLRKSAFPLFLLLAACTSKPEPLVLGKAALPNLVREKDRVTEIRVNARIPGTEAWRIRLARDEKKLWNLVERSDAAGSDLADSALVAHLLENLSSLIAEEEAPSGSDSIFGMTPYRVEVQLAYDDKRTETLLFGDVTGGGNSIFFRREKESTTWIGRGALVLLFASFQSPDFFALKTPYLGSYSDLSEIALEKTFGPDAGKWSVKKKPGGSWPEVVDRILHERWERMTPKADVSSPDWRLRFTISGLPEQTLEIFFAPDGVYGRNPARTSQTMVLYPDFAAALRAFTQARFTPVKSSTK